jgi:alkylated DNA repair dioxygenase AlkB
VKATRSLFREDLANVPEGFRYQEDFLTADDEAALLDRIRGVEFSVFEMRGVVARRRVAFFGQSYDSGDRRTAPMPEFLMPLRDRVAAWVGVTGEAFAMALINEYPPGAPIGWHRDAPQYDIVSGISLLSACRMKFRPYVSPGRLREAAAAGPRKTTHEVDVAPRSIYLLAGPARTAFEHHIPAVTELRYSITFRTLRGPDRGKGNAIPRQNPR